MDQQQQQGRGPTGRRIGAAVRGPVEELRVSLEEYNGRPFVDVRPWLRGPDGVWRPVRGKGATVRVRELRQVADALLAALAAVEGPADAGRPTPADADGGYGQRYRPVPGARPPW